MNIFVRRKSGTKSNRRGNPTEGIATLGGVHPRTVRNNEDGTMVVRPWLFYLLSEQNTNAIMELSVLLKTKGIPRLIASCQRTVATSRRTSKSK